MKYLWLYMFTLLFSISASAQFEVPQIKQTPKGFKKVQHFIHLKGKKVRNLTLGYDTRCHYPLWAAYPVHQAYLGTAKRTNAWHADPLLGENQPKMKQGMGNGYDRGHMMPSNIRTVTREANKQTFMYSNMTAQLHGLNAVRWRFAEKLVHQWAPSGKDTLYVVTGAVLQTLQGKEKVVWVNNKNDHRKMPIPNYYYKILLLRQVDKKGRIIYHGTALWMPHRKLKGKPTAVDFRSIRWVEQQTGLNFFPQLPYRIAQKVEVQNQPQYWLKK
jgi:endonuclease G